MRADKRAVLHEIGHQLDVAESNKSIRPNVLELKNRLGFKAPNHLFARRLALTRIVSLSTVLR
jgi:hypothetical protein